MGSTRVNTISCHFSMMDNTLLPEVGLRAFLVNIIFFGIFKVKGIARPHQPVLLYLDGVSGKGHLENVELLNEPPKVSAAKTSRVLGTGYSYDTISTV